MTLRRSLLFLALALLLGPPPVTLAQCGAGEFALPADRDNTLFEDGAGGLSNGAGPYLFSGNTLRVGLRRALLHFDVAAGVPAGWTVNSATLRLNMSKTIAGPQGMSLHPVLTDWGEGTSDSGSPGGDGTPATPGDATWIHSFYDSSFWTTPGGDFGAPSATVSVAGTGLYAWSGAGTAADVQSWLETPAANYGWILIGNEAVTVTAKRFDSRESAAGVPPVLCVAASPLPVIEIPTLGPTALTLLALALGVVALGRLTTSRNSVV